MIGLIVLEGFPIILDKLSKRLELVWNVGLGIFEPKFLNKVIFNDGESFGVFWIVLKFLYWSKKEKYWKAGFQRNWCLR